MRASRVLAVLACATGALVHCVSDDSGLPPDGGGDASDATTDGPIGDGGGDAIVDAGPPSPDGSLAWLQHFNTNAGFEDLAVNENGPAFVLGGTFSLDPDAGDALHVGTHTLQTQDTVLSSPLLVETASQGPILATTQQEDQVNGPTPACVAYQSYDQGIYTAVAVDATGNIYVAGSTWARYFYLQTNFPGPVSFVAAFSSTGTPLWQHLYSVDGGVTNGYVDNHSTNGYADPMSAKMTLATAGGKVFVAFGYTGTLLYDGQADAGAQTLTSTSQSIFVAALDASNGSTQWHETLASANDDIVEQMVATPQGGVVFTGTMQGTMSGITGTGFPLEAGGDGGTSGPQAYVVKLDATGKPVYAFTYPTDPNVGTSGSLGVAEGNGIVALGGWFSGAVDFGAGPVTSQGGYDGFVTVVDESTLKPKFVQALAGSADEAFDAVALDAWGELFAVGTYGSGLAAAAMFGGALLPQTTDGAVPMLLVKTDATGKLLWSRTVAPSAPDGGAPDLSSGEPQSIFGRRIRTTASGQIAVAGEMSGGGDFGGGYQGVVSTLHEPTFCALIGLGGNKKCECSTRVPDAFVGVWQP